MKRQWLLPLAPLALFACGNANDGGNGQHTSLPAQNADGQPQLSNLRSALDNETEGHAKDAADEAKEAGQDAADAAKDAGQNAKDAAKDAGDSAVETAKSLYESAKERAQQTGESIQAALEDLRKEGEETAEHYAQVIGDSADDARDAIRGAAHDVSDAGQQSAEALREQAERAKHNVQSHKERLDERIDRANAHGLAEKEQLEHITDEGVAQGEQDIDHARTRISQAAQDAHGYMLSKGQAANGFADDLWNGLADRAKQTEQVAVGSAHRAYTTSKNGLARGYDNTKNATEHAAGEMYNVTLAPVGRTLGAGKAWVDRVRVDAEEWIHYGSGRLMGIARRIGSGTRNTAVAAGETAQDAANDARSATAETLREASDSLEHAADKTDPAVNYASVTDDGVQPRVGYALAVEMFADSICSDLSKRKNYGSDEMVSCLAKQRDLYQWWFESDESCKENGFKAEALESCLELAPQTAGGRLGKTDKGPMPGPFNVASLSWYRHCRGSKLCAQ